MSGKKKAMKCYLCKKEIECRKHLKGLRICKRCFKKWPKEAG